MTLTFHANGKIDGINNTNFLDSLTQVQRRISTGPTAMSGGNMEHTVTAGVKKIEIIIANSSSNNNSNMKITLGDSGGHETSGYGYASGFHRGSSTGREGTVTNFTDSFQTYGLDAASYQIWGTWKLWNPHGNTWVGEHIFWGSDASNHTFYGNGYKTLSGTITSVRVHTVGTTFDTGFMTVIETMGTS
mgnify:FL=1|tara:strand:- start:69 stop:635 length:567 start_codon:yes stop_codon:yes gene_type:complete